MTKPDMSSNGTADGDRKLESWKEIAAFFDRDLRTVIRWEKELGLPVHRYPGKSKGRVYAHTTELKAWADGPRRAAGDVDVPSETATAADVADPNATPHVDPSEHLAPAGHKPHRKLIWIAAVAGVLATLLLAAFAASRFHGGDPISSVAVLPFDNLGGESNPAFVDGLTDEISASVSRLGGVRVAGRRSTYEFRGKHDDPRDVGSKLDVEAVVQGSVQRAGDRTHVAVQINRTRDGFTTWSQTFDGTSSDLIGIESEIAAAVARALSGNSDSPIQTPSTTNAEARALYLQGRYLWNQRNFDAEQKSVEYMKQAIAKDPNYAQAWSGLADSLTTIGNIEMVKPSDYIPQARDAARKALELDPNLADAHAVLGRIAAHYDYDWATAESEYKKALALNPSYATAHQYYSLGLMAHDRFSEAQQQLDLARQLDPLALIVGVDLALLRKFQRDYAGVISESERVLQLDPNYHVGFSMLTTGYVMTKRWDDWKKVDAKIPQDPVTRALADGNLAKARQVLTEEVKRGEDGEIPATLVIAQAVRVGDYKLALDWLERAYDDHDYWLLFMNVDPEFDAIRAQPQFQAMMKRLGVA